jgi:homoserine dehydrogenase
MQPVNIGFVGVGNVGGGALRILADNAAQLEARLGFPLRVAAMAGLEFPANLPDLPGALRTTNWREVVDHPDVEIVAELVGGVTVARQVIEAALEQGKAVVTANKELIAKAGPELWARAQAAGVPMAMEASVCGGIPIHAVLREGIAGDRIEALFGILNGTSNYILTQIEKRGAAFDDVLKEAQRLGYAEADPTADVEGYDARSKLALLAALAFGSTVDPAAIHTEGIRRISPVDFAYAHQLNCTIKLLCSARRAENGLFLSVRPSLISRERLIAGVSGVYNGVWVKGRYGDDTFYSGRGAGPLPTGVAVVSDMMRLSRMLRHSQPPRPSPFGFEKTAPVDPLDPSQQRQPWFLRFLITDRPGIIAALATILAKHEISVDAVLQLPGADKTSLPFVITVESAPEGAVRAALAEMNELPFMVAPPLALPIEE